MSNPRLPLRRLLGASPARPSCCHARPAPVRLAAVRALHASPPAPATPLPITAAGPPPRPPLSASADLRHRASAKTPAPGSSSSSSNPALRRFWKEVHVAETPGGFEVRLDKRALKTPARNQLLIPLAKPLLAHAIALEWTHLRSGADALKGHLIPLTQLASRAIDMAAAEAGGDTATRTGIIDTLLRYLDTDTLLCWAPTPPEYDLQEGKRTLRETQIEAAKPITSWVTTRVWPGVELKPNDGDKGIGGTGQPAATREVVREWMKGLDVWRLVGLERTTLAAKSLLVGARLVSEWDERIGEGAWGVREACEVASIEVRWQTRQWGEVEDTHDVEKEDLGRQVGAGWLMIVGNA